MKLLQDSLHALNPTVPILGNLEPGTFEPGLTYVRAHVEAGNELGDAEKVISALLSVLNDVVFCPDLPDGKALCVGISLYWNTNAQSPVSREALEKVFAEDHYQSLRFRVLPDLESPKQEDARGWTTQLELLKPGHVPPTKWDALSRVVAGLFETDRMPMRDLETKFTKLF